MIRVPNRYTHHATSTETPNTIHRVVTDFAKIHVGTMHKTASDTATTVLYLRLQAMRWAVGIIGCGPLVFGVQ